METQDTAASKKGPFADEPIPTYEEFLESYAKDLRATPGVALFKAVVEFVRFIFTREALLVNVLVDKGVLAPDEVDPLLGGEAHKSAQHAGIKSLKKYLLTAAAQGKFVTPGGRQINPDDVLVIMDKLLDLNDEGWSGSSVEAIYGLYGQDKSLKDLYERRVEAIQKLNRARAGMRAAEEEDRARDARDREERARRLRIYMSQCNIADKAPPTAEEAQKMLDGTLPIPEIA